MNRREKQAGVKRAVVTAVIVVGLASMTAVPAKAAQRLVLAEYFTSLF